MHLHGVAAAAGQARRPLSPCPSANPKVISFFLLLLLDRASLSYIPAAQQGVPCRAAEVPAGGLPVAYARHGRARRLS